MTGSIMSKNEERVKFNIVRDLADHTITVLHSGGLYRHYRCQKPGTGVMGFDIITWPGFLCYTGDMGEFLFERTRDMIPFMRSACMSYSYADEKCVAHGSEIEEFDERRFREVLQERLKEFESDRDSSDYRGQDEEVEERIENAKNLIEEIESEYSDYGDPHDAKKAMHESGLWEGCDIPSCEEYTYHFLWCLHAISWFCERVDK